MTRKSTSLPETTSFDVLIVKNRKNPKKLAKSLDAHFNTFGGERGNCIVMKFCMG